MNKELREMIEGCGLESTGRFLKNEIGSYVIGLGEEEGNENWVEYGELILGNEVSSGEMFEWLEKEGFGSEELSGLVEGLKMLLKEGMENVGK